MKELAERIGYPMLIQIIIECWNELLLLLLIVIMQIGKHRDRSDELVSKVNIPLTNELIFFYAAILFYNFANIITLFYEGHDSPDSYYVMRIGVFVYYLVGAIQTVFFLYVIKKYIARKNNNKRLENVITGFQLLELPNVLLLIATPFSNALYSFSEKNEYLRSWGYYVWQGITILTFLFIGAVAVLYRKQTDGFMKRVIAVAFLFPIIGFLLSMISSEFNFNNIMVSVAELLLFMLYEQNKTDVTLRYGYELERAKTELAETRINLMQAQIKPHFINNAMIAVQEVCYTEPERAAELIGHFAKYLRNNINASTNGSPVDFMDEVQAIKEYLAIEYADTTKKFSFEYELGCSAFKVPALSIEPFAENAVKHGIDRYSADSRVILRSYEDDNAYHIEVRDNGKGFDMNPETLGKGGIGFKNAEDRLRLLCGGSIEIKRDDGWTVVEILIPKTRSESK